MIFSRWYFRLPPKTYHVRVTQEYHATQQRARAAIRRELGVNKLPTGTQVSREEQKWERE